MDELKNRPAALNRLKPYFPRIISDIKGKSRELEEADTLWLAAGLSDMAHCRFWDRLYGDFKQMGADPEEGLELIAANIKAHVERMTRPVQREYAGLLKPIPEMEELDLDGFTKLMTPYIRATVKGFVNQPVFQYAQYPEQLDEYASMLAHDMYIAARSFRVPLTLIVTIAHQETHFANVLGDNAMSASPFQIYQPTKPLIVRKMGQDGLPMPNVPQKLEKHLTLATYMAAFHMVTLMDRHTKPWQEDRPALCDLDRVAKSYNGGDAYPGYVLSKKKRLMAYLEKVRLIAEGKKAPTG
jgi:hypothetical protein